MIGISLLVILVFFAVYIIKKRQYEKTEYYQQTKNLYLTVLFNKGLLGEFYTYKYLKSLIGYKRYLFNLYIPKDSGETTELDVVLLHESGIYVLESKNYSGWIFGTETQQYWTQTLPAQIGEAEKIMHIRSVQQKKQANISQAVSIPPVTSTPLKTVCPYCGGKLVIRVAAKGSHQGKRFLGCSNYPKCRYIENIPDRHREEK